MLWHFGMTHRVQVVVQIDGWVDATDPIGVGDHAQATLGMRPVDACSPVLDQLDAYVERTVLQAGRDLHDPGPRLGDVPRVHVGGARSPRALRKQRLYC